MKKKENKSLFLECLGDTPQLRVFDFLIENHFFDFPMTEIARESNVSYNSIKVFFSKMIKGEFIIKTRKVGKSDYYKSNLENRQVQLMMQLGWAMTKKALFPEQKVVA